MYKSLIRFEGQNYSADFPLNKINVDIMPFFSELYIRILRNASGFLIIFSNLEHFGCMDGEEMTAAMADKR